MGTREVTVVRVIIGFIILLLVFDISYAHFDYYPTYDEMKEELPLLYSPIIKVGQLWAISQNQRITLETEIPQLPVSNLPVYKGNSSTAILKINFSDSANISNIKDDEIYFAISNDSIQESEAIAGKLEVSGDSKIENSKDYIIDELKNGDFLLSEGTYPMSALGRVKIQSVELVYYGLFDNYDMQIEEKTYYPAWRIEAITSNYGNQILFIRASIN
ncbi:MAG: hypothetical protein PWQ51_1709 [Methanolobus sp.]|nr:hypothetical protein [Methanolobus sp.]